MYNTISDSLELLNSEGPILQAIKWNGLIYLIDEKKNLISSMNVEEFESFIEGDIVVTDTLNRTIQYTSFSAAKPTPSQIKSFLES